MVAQYAFQCFFKEAQRLIVGAICERQKARMLGVLA